MDNIMRDEKCVFLEVLLIKGIDLKEKLERDICT
tara:strand:+ start:103 stop:204 length:102 start_codon:yes stop_codon:yes gene_type:complete